MKSLGVPSKDTTHKAFGIAGGRGGGGGVLRSLLHSIIFRV